MEKMDFRQISINRLVTPVFKRCFQEVLEQTCRDLKEFQKDADSIWLNYQ